jgi:ubiquinone/menaquinone biosynthesis C-methylase UbiE
MTINTTVDRSNLSPKEWSAVWGDDATPTTVANDLMEGKVLPWTETLEHLLMDCTSVLDLGSGRGEHSAILAQRGKQTTLMDWSRQNLDFSIELFRELGVRGQFQKGDITHPLPFETASFDAVFCCGVLEFLTDETIRSVLREALRVARKRVIVMVPNAWCLPYRIGKWQMEKAGTWVWTGESPFYTFKPYFRSFEKLRLSEFSVAAKHSLKFLQMPLGQTVRDLLTKLLGLQDHGRHARFKQGYLLVTVGDKDSHR